ncbi:MAG TPA: spore germination protein [Syntrophomonadaceae bacterium]|nr:spore germination protein [Syntrophomonadaceae bacterium]
MFSYLKRKLGLLSLANKMNNDSDSEPEGPVHSELSNKLKNNIAIISDIVGVSEDFVIREFKFGLHKQIDAALLFFDGLVKSEEINHGIIRPLMYESHLLTTVSPSCFEDIRALKETLLAIGEVTEANTIEELMEALFSGNAILLLDGNATVLMIDVRGWASRGVEESKTEQSVRGPHESFTENIRFNTALLRRRIQDPDLLIEYLVLGKKSRTAVCIAYLKTVAHPELVEELKRRLNRIDIDAVLESGYIEQLIEDDPFSPFATVGNSERPDRIAARVLEGRVAILVDTTPYVLTVPMLFLEGFQAPEDYYSRPYYSSIVRLLRFVAFFITLLSPALYVALTTYHVELIPTSLFITMVAAEEGTPFPAVLEAIGMGLVFEILREGGARLPTIIGPALSIVGALIIGDLAVSAGLVSAPMIIVVALTAVSSFLVIGHTDAITLMRLILVLLAGVLGAFGIAIGLLGMLIHLTSLRSFGVPYLTPWAPSVKTDLKDSMIRAPLWKMILRPRLITEFDSQREAFRLKPHPPENP